ncbi:MAG TPA: excinuclease ABC subunit UvrC [Candidatus Sulfotelmatobacter sp.]|nr:excinuclease ABC subunit UvrC [Candidatus Sulfotelmatobacter sp.]
MTEEAELPRPTTPDALDRMAADRAATPRRGRVRALEDGIAVIAAAVEKLPQGPGVYRMLDETGEALYVGKARSLKKRVASYATPAKLSNRLARMIAETASLEVVVTHTEVEALLLESNLIKRLMPRFNVLLRDDKSFPYIHVTGDHAFPQIAKHRGARSRKGDYFGPFASAGAVGKTIVALQRAFLLRNCSDAVFAARTRPCLQYQIKRCAAPCVGRISETDYAVLVDQARAFLTGKSGAVQKRLAESMQGASEALDFESAARYRDRIRALAQVQAHQDINVGGLDDADVIVAHQAGGQTCIQVFFFRGGSNFGNRAYFPSHERGLEAPAVLASFIGQFYDDKLPPPLVLISHDLEEQALIAEALSIKAGSKVALYRPARGSKRKVLDHALTNAREALARRLAEGASQRRLLEGVAATFGLDQSPARIEVYDNSHISGTNALGAMIVAGVEGFDKSAYRRFNIRHAADPKAPDAAAPVDAPSVDAPPAGLPVAVASQAGMAEAPAEPWAEAFTPGDDYGMMREVLTRRFGRALREDPERQGPGWPDLVLLDGGAGQLSAARVVMAELGLDDIAIAAIAKGPDRNAGRERFFLPDRTPFSLDLKDPVLYYLQRLRDEAHRFAIGGHRARRERALGRSELDEIAGIGAARRRALLHHFGSVRAIARAGLSDLERVSGISRTVAKKVYDHFHPGG